VRGLTAQNVLEIWEWAESEHPASRALSLLSAAIPEYSWQQLADLSVGQRNSRLIDLREKTFGTDLQAQTVCQHCGESLEFDIATSDMRVNNIDLTQFLEVEIKNYKINYRLPNSHDLLAIADCDSVIQANHLLLQRCIVDVDFNSKSIEVEVLPSDVIALLSQEMSSCDPQAELVLNLQCPSCDQEGQSEFDISAYLWTEFEDLAKRVLQQVHILAVGYGWHEADILAMSAWRRRYYQGLLNL